LSYVVVEPVVVGVEVAAARLAAVEAVRSAVWQASPSPSQSESS
jgi:hypothetical protein